MPEADILVVDDEPAHLRALVETLTAHGYAARACSSAPEALEALRVKPCALLLTDLHMARMDGIALMKAAQAMDARVAVVIMTGAGTIEAAVDAMRGGAADFLLKPLKMRTALPVLERVLQIRRLRIENEALQRRVREQMGELEAANRELEAFSYSVSHDLRAPLQAIEGFSGALEARHASQLDEKGRHYLARIRAGSARMAELVDGLLQFARLGRTPMSRGPVDMAALANAALDELRASGHADAHRVTIDAVPTAAEGDAVLLRQVFANLLSNACKFSALGEAPLVQVGAVDTPDGIAWFVRDNGAGFDSAHADKLFQPFHRFHTQSEYTGIGIGLSLVQRIVERHGGRVWAASSPGAGACFYFTLGRAASRASA